MTLVLAHVSLELKKKKKCVQKTDYFLEGKENRGIFHSVMNSVL